MSRKDDKSRRTDVKACLEDIRDSAATIEEYIADITEARFHADSLAGVPLPEAKLMRNKLIHEYEGVDVGLVWDTAKNDVPDLRKKVIEAIQRWKA